MTESNLGKSIAELRSQLGQPPDVVLVDWSAQLIQLLIDAENSGQRKENSIQSSRPVTEEGLIVDELNQLRFSSDFRTTDGNPWFSAESLIRRWYSTSTSTDPGLMETWNHVLAILDSRRSIHAETSAPTVDPLPKTATPTLELQFTSKGSPSPAGKSCGLGARSHLRILLIAASLVLFVAVAWFAMVVRDDATTSVERTTDSIVAGFASERPPNSKNGEEEFAIELSNVLERHSIDLKSKASDIELEPKSHDLASLGVTDSPLNFPIGEIPSAITNDALEPRAVEMESRETESNLPDEPMVAEGEADLDNDVPALGFLPQRTSQVATKLAQFNRLPDRIELLWPNRVNQLLRLTEPQQWEIRDSNDIAMATITVSDGELQWRWCEAAKVSPLATQLFNARLSIRSDGGTKIIDLRQPIKYDSFSPKHEQGDFALTWNLGVAPDARSVVNFRCQIPDGVVCQLQDLTAGSVRRGQGAALFADQIHPHVAVRVRFAWSGTRRWTLRSRTELRLDASYPWWSANVESLDERSRLLELNRLTTEQNLKGVKEEYSNTRKEPKRTQLKQLREQLTARIAQIDQANQRMTAARALLHELETKAKWQVEILTPWEDGPQSILTAGNLDNPE